MIRGSLAGSCLLALFSTLIASPAQGQSWADKLFTVKTHDFGVVARNAKTEFLFEIENPFALDVEISGVRTSCGCTTPTILKKTLTTYEKGGLLATYNTDRFLGKRGATLTVTFTKPRFTEVQLRVDGEIRSDIVAEPSGIDFASVPLGEPAERALRISYQGGRADWKLTGVRTANEHLACELVEVERRAGRVVYELKAKLNDQAPVGYLNEAVVVSTNDSRAPNLPIQISGRVAPSVTVSPADLLLGVVHPGDEVTRKLVVIGKEPFKIVRIDGDMEGGHKFEFEMSDAAKKIHIIPVTFKAGEKPGKVYRTLSVVTDLANNVQIQCTAAAAVMEATK